MGMLRNAADASLVSRFSSARRSNRPTRELRRQARRSSQILSATWSDPRSRGPRGWLQPWPPLATRSSSRTFTTKHREAHDVGQQRLKGRDLARRGAVRMETAQAAVISGWRRRTRCRRSLVPIGFGSTSRSRTGSCGSTLPTSMRIAEAKVCTDLRWRPGTKLPFRAAICAMRCTRSTKAPPKWGFRRKKR